MPTENEPLTRAEFIRREVGKGRRSAWAAAAVAVIAIATSLAYVFWRGAGFVAIMIAILLFSYALRRIGHRLPFSDHSRQRWAHRRSLQRKYTSYDYIGFLWVGIGMAIGCLLSFWRHDSVELDHLVVPGISIALGGLAAVRWLSIDKKREEAAASFNQMPDPNRLACTESGRPPPI